MLRNEDLIVRGGTGMRVRNGKSGLEEREREREFVFGFLGGRASKRRKVRRNKILVMDRPGWAWVLASNFGKVKKFQSVS